MINKAKPVLIAAVATSQGRRLFPEKVPSRLFFHQFATDNVLANSL